MRVQDIFVSRPGNERLDQAERYLDFVGAVVDKAGGRAIRYGTPHQFCVQRNGIAVVREEHVRMQSD